MNPLEVGAVMTTGDGMSSRPRALNMKKLVPIPQDSLERLMKESSSELRYRFVSVKLKDGKLFEQAVESEGCIIQVKGHRSVPFTEIDVDSVEASDKRWNFRRRGSMKTKESP
jgi:hypothetical protein